MLNTVRSSGGRRIKKAQQNDKKSRQSVRYPHGSKSPLPSSRNHGHPSFNRAPKKRPTIFRRQHIGQSVGASVEHAVFEQINNPHLHLSHHETLQRRPSISSKKKREEQNIRKHVAEKANVHQQLIKNMAKQQNSHNPHSQNASFPSSPNRSLHENDAS